MAGLAGVDWVVGEFVAEVVRDGCVCHWGVCWVVWGVEDSILVCLGVELVLHG